MDFDALAEERRSVKELCRRHVASLEAFRYKSGASFHVLRNEPEPDDNIVHHLTTTATCIQSLQDCHETFWPKGALAEFGETKEHALGALKQAFYQGASKRPKWVSEDSAPIYCSTRTLPLFLGCNDEWTSRHASLVGSIYKQLKEPDRFGIGERTGDRVPSDPKWYPENAYHTYWARVVLDLASKRLEKAAAKRVFGADPERLKQSMGLWAKAKLCDEVALHWAQSAALDSDQLVWALTMFIEFEADISSNLRAQDLIRKSFDALGSTQENIGTWRHYRPLFVYSNVGNAYCYIYESFTYLLKAVLKRFEEEEFLEGVLRAFVDRLQQLRKYAEMTQVRYPASDAIAWSSGHRPKNPEPEGWATASVFSFLQMYRRLLGILTRRDALHMLNRPVMVKGQDPLKTLAERGDTWPPLGRPNSVAADLITLFINPVRMNQPEDRSEPDDQLIEESQARSAILLGVATLERRATIHKISSLWPFGLFATMT